MAHDSDIYQTVITRSLTMHKEQKGEKKTSAFMKPVQVSSELAAIVGPGPIARTEITKRLWEYIKKHRLQDANNKRKIRPDDKLGKLFGSSEAIDMFEMARKVARHIKEPERQLSSSSR